MIPIEQQFPTCGDCCFWHQMEAFEGPIGECYFNPPGIQVDEEGYALVRPILDKAERACGQFKGAQ